MTKRQHRRRGCGLAERWKGSAWPPRCLALRPQAVAPVHDRMPVMLMPADYDRWLDPATTVDELRGMLKPYDAELMKAYEVSRVVNSVANDTPASVEPTP